MGLIFHILEPSNSGSPNSEFLPRTLHLYKRFKKVFQPSKTNIRSLTKEVWTRGPEHLECIMYQLTTDLHFKTE